MSFIPTYETAPPTPTSPATAPLAAIERTSPLECAWTAMSPAAATEAPSSIGRRDHVVEHEHDDSRGEADLARDRECCGDAQE